MNRFKLWALCFGLFCSIPTLAGQSPYELDIDATHQKGRPPRGRGPFPGSAFPGHSEGFPVRIDLSMTSGKLDSNRKLPIDFIITNVGVESIKLPCSADVSDILPSQMLTFYLTTDAPIEKKRSNTLLPFQSTTAELDGQSSEPQTFCLLGPGKAIRVSAYAIFGLKHGKHSVTAHVELLALAEGKSEVLGTAEAIPVDRVFRSPEYNER